MRFMVGISLMVASCLQGAIPELLLAVMTLLQSENEKILRGGSSSLFFSQEFLFIFLFQLFNFELIFPAASSEMSRT